MAQPVAPEAAPPDEAAPRARSIAERLVASYAEEDSVRVAPGHELPSPPDVRLAIAELRELLFPGSTTSNGLLGSSVLKALVEARLAQLRVRLSVQIFRGLHHRCARTGGECAQCEQRSLTITDGLLESLPALRATLLVDVRAAYEGDPAASGTDEVLFAYPGVQAMVVHRVANRIYRLGAPIVPRIMSELAHSETGIDIHPAATIGAGIFIDHGTGVVVGETSIIGERVRIYQGVTLGALSLPTAKVRALSAEKRHPTIEDNVIIYANATILGGETVIGKGAVIGGNCWITESVPPGARRSV